MSEHTYIHLQKSEIVEMPTSGKLQQKYFIIYINIIHRLLFMVYQGQRNGHIAGQKWYNIGRVIENILYKILDNKCARSCHVKLNWCT